MEDYQIIQGDCLEQMAKLEANSVDAIVTDPPYGIRFMGNKWDYNVPSVEVWQECLRVLKPGGHLLCFAGTRTHHRMACNIEDAGFDIRDMIAWVYGSGFPKSHNISKAIDKAAGVEREVIGVNEDYLKRKPNGMKTNGATVYNYSKVQQETDADITAPATEASKQWDGWGTALKPALEPITVARKPFKGTVANNVLEHGTGGLNINECRVPGQPETTRFNPAKHTHDGYRMTATGEETAAQAHNTTGRWPANLIHDGSEEVLEHFPDSTGQQGDVKGTEPSHTGMEGTHCYGEYARTTPFSKRGDSGSSARFFYCPKTNKKDRGPDNKHPTVKPTDLMRYLCRLVTPPGGLVLDPFMGSGSTGKACVLEGFMFVGCELDPDWCAVAEGRILETISEKTND